MSEEIAKLVLYGLIFLATILAIEGAYLYWRDVRGAKKRINKRLELIDSGLDRATVAHLLRRNRGEISAAYGPLAPFLRRLDKTLSQAGIATSAPRAVAMMAGLTAVVALVMFAALSAFTQLATAGGLFLLILFGVAIGFGLPLIVIGRRRDKRINKFVEQFPVALDVFIRGLRAGHPVSSALELLTVEMPDPVGTEFGLVIDEVTYGLELRDALQNMADRVNVDDVHMFVVSVSVQSETGGNLSEILENLAGVIRERASLVMKVRALSSEGRMTGWVLSAAPVLAFLSIFACTPQFYLDTVDDPVFMPGALILLGLFMTGVWIIRRLVDIKV